MTISYSVFALSCGGCAGYPTLHIKKLSISTKIVFLFSLLVALSAAITGFASYNILALARSERALVDGDGASMRWAASAQEHMTSQHQLVFQIDDTDFAAGGALRSRLADEENALNSDMDHFHAVMTPDERSLYGAIRARSARYAAFAANDIGLLQTAGRARAKSQLLSSGVQAFDEADAAFDQMLAKQARDMDADASDAAGQARQALWLMLLASILGVAAVGAVVLVSARRTISEPLAKITEAMARLAAGDNADVLAPSDRRDEIGDLARVFTVFRQTAIALLATQKDAEEQRRLVEIERLSGGFFRSAIESSMDSVRVLDLEGRLKFMNRGALVAFEIDDFAPLAGRLCKSLWPEPAATQIGMGIEAALRGETHRFEGRCPTASGVEKWWDVFIAPVRDDAGELAAIIATSRDITAAYQLRIEAEARALELDRSAAALRSAFLIAHVGGWEVDFVADRVFFSPEICELIGQPPLPAMPLAEANAFWCDEDRVRFEEALVRVQASGERLVFEGRSAGAGKSWRLFGEPVLDGDRCVALRGAAQDISDWRDAMERERAALRAAEAMSGFLATMGHELRTPLNGVLGMAQSMGRGELSPQQRERLATIEASGAALLSLLNDLLDLSKIEAGKIELEDGVVDVDVLAHEARAVFGELIRDEDVTFSISAADDARGCWRGDPTRIRQMLHNLISNAVKFTGHGSIRVDISAGDGGLVFKIQDSGIGIAADKLDAVFERFVQADASTTRRFGGSGLGLTICRDLVVLMGGDILVESVEGRGTTFTVNLPLERLERPSKAPDAAPAVGPAPGAVPLRVLAAEDNPINQIVLRTLLGEVGLEATIVGNGQEALDAWRNRPWDIVLMDIQMPVMDGVTAVKSMREIERREGRVRTPVIAVTANAMAHQEATYRAAGMDAMVAKPINLTLLLGAMDAALPSVGDESSMVA
jgi:PAS domain S-box-containing protein